MNSLQNYKKRAKNQGFTLVELMIAISILSLLLFTGSYTYSLMSERWNKELGQFNHSAKNYKHLELIQRLLEGVQPYVVVDDNKKPSFFFIGDDNSLLAVSRSGLFSGDYPEIFRLSTIDAGEGKVDLIYQSASTEQILLKGTDQSINFTHQLVLFSNLDNVQFSYYGWPHLYEKNALDKKGKKAQWYTRFSGINNQIMPEKYAVTLTQAGKDLSIPIQLEARPERWLSPYFKENQ
ncbi:PulJ/GspJ family protein [Cognaticolwellia mytili]|uniref:PulJ/GspJ family protein n=1 Tax=Cognaticolwellia mytili TaxID=1888913 RepID=UPI000A16D64D|nr:type II secretion system protein [Cognaticolwellia mytili]